MNKSIINILPTLLKRLSNGEQLNIPNLSKELDIPSKTIQDNFKKYLQPIENADIHFDKSVNAWVARQGFLSETLLSEHEIITMQLLEQSANRFGRQYIFATKRLFNRFKRRASLTIFRKTRIEQIGKDDEIKFALIKTAIKNKKVLYCRYNQQDRIVHPLKIVLLEGYWYLFFWDPANNEVRKYYIKSMEAVEIKNETFKNPKNKVIDHLDNAINAYFQGKDPFPIALIIHKKVIKYFERQPLSKEQRITEAPKYGTKYFKLEIWVTNEMEIIPTIQQYLPYIKVESPDSLNEKILENLKNYNEFNLPE